MGQRLGQHFLTSKNVVGDIVKAADIKSGESVLEIGPGKGVLTERLLESGAKVVAVEKDQELAEYLRTKFEQHIKTGRLVVVREDIRQFEPTTYNLQLTTYKLVANIPYYITGELLRTFLSGRHQPTRIIFLVQHEIARRIATDPKESILSISVKAYGNPKLVKKVPKRYFSPPPKVDSAILAITDISKDLFGDLDESFFFRVLRAGFSHKRKLLLNNLKEFADREKLTETFEKLNLPEEVRAEGVSLKKWKALAIEMNRLYQ